ncbi:hypothetical protein C8Q80DRAFT_1097781 [Daedaleopsis nitida]|nr:hypothetical protein C8Q80DRAFT_1097781 [Daedaleopsis nitida]
MGSSRRGISDPSPSTQPTGLHHKNSKRPQHKKHPTTPPSQSSTALPGVQKLKAALRQTRRLLAKDKLAADVRVATERRLKALEADLAQAEQARLERTMATRYHKVKFFERQKVTRKIAQMKRQLEGKGKDGEEKEKELGKKERKKLEARLAALRVDLNYILHYPKAKKYISLFPPEVRQGERVGKEKAEEEEETSETNRQREEVREWVREQMETGAFSSEPEVELAKTEGKKAVTASREYKTTKTKDSPEGGKSRPSHHAVKGGLVDDDFFATHEDEDGEQEEEAGEDVSEEGSEEEDDSEMDED